MKWLINRRRMLLNKTLPPASIDNYVKDGLIFQLDGLEKGATDGSWVDLVGGNVFTGTATSIANGFSFNETYLECNMLLPANENYTVECIFTPAKSLNGCLFISSAGNTVNYPCLYISGTSALFIERKNYYRITTTVGVSAYISFNLSNGLMNGNAISPTASTDYWTGNGKTTIGQIYVGGGRSYYGNIYSIRVYSRRLTSEEQIANYNVDKSRYKL